MKYDAWNRLAEVREGGAVIATYEYDGLRRRTLEMPSWPGTTYWMHSYWNSAWQMLEMRQNTNDAAPESSGVARQLIWSARYIDAPVLEEVWGTRRYLLGDANFNVTSVIDTSGEAVEHYQYDPYGVVTVLNGGAPDGDGAEWTADPDNSTDVGNHTLYTGRWQDYRSWFYDYRTRPYHADLARFLSRDPIGYGAGDPNLYSYVGGSPTVAVDPFGFQGLRESGLRNRALRNELLGPHSAGGRRSRPIERDIVLANALLDVHYPAAIGQGALDIAEGVPNAAIRVVNQAAEAAVAQRIPIGSLVARLVQGRSGCGDEGIVPDIREWHWAESLLFPEDHAWHEATTTLGGESGLMLITLGIGEVVQLGRLGAAAPGALTGDLLSAPDAALVRSLQGGADIAIPRGTQGIRALMSDLTINTGNEVALLRMAEGSRVLRMGGPRSVQLGLDVDRVIAHTHPSGRLAFSPADVAALRARLQHSSVIIDPRASMGARIPVPRRSP